MGGTLQYQQQPGTQPRAMPQATPTPTPVDPFMQRFLGIPQSDPDAIYQNYLNQIQMPQRAAHNWPTPTPPKDIWGKVVAGTRNVVPYMDTPLGHQDLQNTLQTYPFTPEASKLLSSGTVVRDSMKHQVVEEEAETNPEKVFGLMPTGRDTMQIASKLDLSPRPSVMAHELMHSYLDHKGYPYGQDAFNKDWEAAKKTTPILGQIDSFIRSSPDYADEMNRTDISQERYAYLAQAMSGGGLKAFPEMLRRHYAPVFR